MSEQYRDLQRLAQKRTRDAVGLVLQLLDDQEERSAVLLACTVDFIHGLATSIKENADEEINDDAALAAASIEVMRALGLDALKAAMKMVSARAKK